MAWSTPADFTTHEAVTSTKMNTIVSNLRYLHGDDGLVDREAPITIEGATAGPTIKHGNGYRKWWAVNGLAGAGTVLVTGSVTSRVVLYTSIYDETAGVFRGTIRAESRFLLSAPGNITLYSAGGELLQATLNAPGAVFITRASGVIPWTVFCEALWT